jgi:nucleotide-binding universal stress UspA family protein
MQGETSMKKPKKILIPLDGSDRAMGTVRYITKIDPFLHMHLVLFHVFSSVPEGFWDMETDPRSIATVKQVRALEIERRKNIQRYMDDARRILLKAGVPEDAVTLKIQNRKKGFARDIIREAQDNYDAVVTRRRGMTGLRGIVLGSVATKLIEKLAFIPLVLAGRKPPGNKILLAYDGSEGSRHAVDFVGRMLGGCDFEICLMHAVRGREQKLPDQPQLYSPRQYVESARKEMTAELTTARNKLIDMGFKAHQLSTRLVTGVASRAGAIVAEAQQENYGTIVMGRRGLSRVREFFIGRVTNKVVHLARERTVWIIR